MKQKPFRALSNLPLSKADIVIWDKMSRGNLHNPEKVKVKISLIILQFEHETALVSLNFLENNGLSLRQKHSL